MKLLKIEKETLILFNEEERAVRIQTYNSLLRRRLISFCKRYPRKSKVLRYLEQEGIIAEIDRKCLSIHLIPPYTAERKNQMRCVGRKTQADRR